ncbi:arsenite efflux transporter metallochaperone ArsD [Alkalilimnicola ehrlichii MLHE-1]|uniref:Arsenical resistance operon trans-acting repressor ArsD n=1 Tax=Alkalilimnicola ehrlichii (strain ATCC BAA-1101 / DSM 17681 / MLHE-1) TaxID=187272 RepID=Q0A536_ALKEH|nr:arsenite efflux transporter metallochaperone ArsD [Alkalilimnicola ehrlichii]ABI58051.1 Arsenical resistance operon trans-acting repressor ArsD [Alkalilimnicola ehrlichii MLHE-1]
MTELTVFDPPQCCSTGVCGPSVDPKLSKLAADLDWVKKQGVSVIRYNLSQQPGAFVENATVKDILQRRGEDALPVFLVDGEVMSQGSYPDRQALAAWVGIKAESADTESAGGCGGNDQSPGSGCC